MKNLEFNNILIHFKQENFHLSYIFSTHIIPFLLLMRMLVISTIMSLMPVKI